MRAIIKRSLILAAVAWILTATAGFAAEVNTPSQVSQVDYSTGVGKKLSRGIANTAFGWLEIPKGIQDVGDERNFVAGVTWGPVYGTGKAVARTLAGVYEIVTFPFAVPSHFEPLVKPEFILEDQR